TVALHQTNTAPSFQLWTVYAIVATSITFGMVVILNAEAAEPKSVKYHEKRKHAYERGSIMFTRLFVCAVTLLAIVAGVMAYRIELPGQAFSKRIEVKIEKVAIYPIQETKKDGL